MKVHELIEMLQQVRQDLTVRIPVEVGHVTLGGTPCREVENIDVGFDWDSGSLFLETKDKLTTLTREEYIDLIRYKQLISSMRGHTDLKNLSDVFIRKEDVYSLLRDGWSSGWINEVGLSRLAQWVKTEELK